MPCRLLIQVQTDSAYQTIENSCRRLIFYLTKNVIFSNGNAYYIDDIEMNQESVAEMLLGINLYFNIII
jgi:hypothetical protein